MTESAAPQPPTPDDKIDFRRVLPVIFIVFIDLMGLTILIPILAYYAIAFDASPFTVGLLLATYPLMQFIGGPILGSLSDRFGRKPVLAVAQVGTFLSLLMLGFANSLWMLFLARTLDGITGANLPTAQAAVTDITTSKNRSQGLGLIGAAFGVGFVFGPALSGAALTLSGNDYSAPAFMASGFAFISILLTVFVFQETLPPEKRGQPGRQQRGLLAFGRMWEGLRKPAIGILFLIIFLQQVIFGAFQSMFSPFTLTRLGLNSVGNTVLFVYIGVLLAATQGGAIGPLTKRFGERNLIFAGLGLIAIGLFGMGLTPEIPVPWYQRAALIEELQTQTGGQIALTQVDLLPPEEGLGIWGLVLIMLSQTPLAIGIGLLQPSLNSLITQRVDKMEVGAALGLSAAFLSLANVIGPLWGGAVFDFVAPAAPFLIGGVLSAAVLVLARRRIAPIPATEAQGAT